MPETHDPSNTPPGDPNWSDAALPAPQQHGVLRHAPGPRADDDLMSMLRKLWRRNGLVLAVAAATFTLALVAVKSMTPLYTATAEVLIGTPANDMLAQTAGERPRIDAEAVQSQARIIASRTIAVRVAERLALDTDPEFNPYLRDRRTWADILLGRGASSTPASEVPEKIQMERVVDVLLSKTAVAPTDRSHVLNVQVSSADPQLAARATNAFANLYVEQIHVHRTETTQKANTWLRSQLTELRRQVDEDERAVERYRKAHGLYEANAATVSTQQLGELNSQLIMAESAKAEADARLSQAEAVLNSGGELDSIPEVVNSPLIQALEEKEAEIQRQAAELSSTYGPMHPRIENIKAQQRDTREKIRSEVRKIVSSVRNASLTAGARYETLRARLESAKSEVGQSNVDSVDLRQLQREAEASQALLANFLERYKRSSAQETYQQSSAWIISPASAPARPDFPPTKPVLAGALLAGLLLGALLAMFIEMLDRTFRTGEDVAATTGLPALALIPTFRKSELAGDRIYDPDSPFSEAIHKLHMRMLFAHDGETPKVTMFTSAAPDEGKSHISVSLARRLAHVGRRVIIVDGDLRRPSVHALLNARNGPGLIDLLNGDATPDETVYRDPASGVHAIFAGRIPKGESRLPDVSRLRMLLASLAKHYDTVILDAPPILAGAEVIHYARLVDTTVFVVRWGRTKKDVVLDGLRQLLGADARIAGVALSQVHPKKYRRYATVGLHYPYPRRRGLAGGLS